MYEDVYGDGGYAGEHNDGELDGGKHDGDSGGGGGGEDYGSLQYDYYEEGPEDGGGGGGGGGGDNDVDIYGDADEGMGMEVDAGQQPGQQEAQPSGQQQQQQQRQQQAQQSGSGLKGGGLKGGGLKGGAHPGNLALLGGGGDGGSPSRDDDRWGADQDASPRHDQQGKQPWWPFTAGSLRHSHAYGSRRHAVIRVLLATLGGVSSGLAQTFLVRRITVLVVVFGVGPMHDLHRWPGMCENACKCTWRRCPVPRCLPGTSRLTVRCNIKTHP